MHVTTVCPVHLVLRHLDGFGTYLCTNNYTYMLLLSRPFVPLGHLDGDGMYPWTNVHACYHCLVNSYHWNSQMEFECANNHKHLLLPCPVHMYHSYLYYFPQIHVWQ